MIETKNEGRSEQQGEKSFSACFFTAFNYDNINALNAKNATIKLFSNNGTRRRVEAGNFIASTYAKVYGVIRSGPNFHIKKYLERHYCFFFLFADNEVSSAISKTEPFSD